MCAAANCPCRSSPPISSTWSNRTGKRPVYEQPARFFPLTFATTSLRDIVAGTAERLRGRSLRRSGSWEMTYGGGKTHTLVTLTHIFRDPDTLPDVPSVHEFESAMGGKAPKARVGAVCFDKLDLEAGIRAIAPDGSARVLKQPWSVIAYQLAGDDRAAHDPSRQPGCRARYAAARWRSVGSRCWRRLPRRAWARSSCSTES